MDAIFVPMENIYSIPPSEQAERCRALFKYLDRQCMKLVATYCMLVPSWTLQTLIDLLQILEHDYSDWHTNISEQGRQSLPDWAVKVFEEQGGKDAEASRKEFWERADMITGGLVKTDTSSREVHPRTKPMDRSF